jgi:hypothetical protein
VKENIEYRNSSVFIHKKSLLCVLTLIISLLAAPSAVKAQDGKSSDQPQGSTLVVAARLRPLVKLLPERLAGMKASGAAKEFTDNFTELAGERAAIFEEFHVRQAASRQYGNLRVDVFETPSQYAAYGLFSFNAGATKETADPIGSDSRDAGGDLVFWKDNCFVRIISVNGNSSQQARKAIAKALAASIKPGTETIQRPALLGSLPEGGVAQTARYALGPQALGSYIDRHTEMFRFIGDAEAVVAEYRKPDEAESPAAKLVIVEYHTPQFATEGTAVATSYLEALNEEERSRVILKREGNFLIAALNVTDRAFAQSLVDLVKYPYVVQWLQTPRGPAGDPLQAYKAAQLLVSVFTLLGLLLLTVLVVGSVVGAIIFLKRRKRQREVFSNAGDMVRLDLDPFESVILGLPPKRGEGE